MDATTLVVDLTDLVKLWMICFMLCKPGQNSKCSSYDKPKETAVIKCSSCEQWLPFCCAGVSASDDVVEFESAPFYCSQCLSTDTDRQQASSSQDPTHVTIVIAKQAQGERRQSNVHSAIGPFTFLAWKFQENMLKHFLVGTATPSSTHYIPKTPQLWAHPDWPHFFWHLYSIPIP